MDYFKIDIDDLIVVVDDMALEPGKIRLRLNGSSGGHNGLKNINALIGSQNFARIRFGLGNEFHRGQQVDFVLGKWSDEEKPVLKERIAMAVDMIKSFVAIGLQLTMTQFNNK